MTQLEMWGPARPRRTDLERVQGRIATEIVERCRQWAGREIHLAILIDAVTGVCLCTPDSVSRVLRELRRAGRVRYRVICRARSLYLIEGANA